MFSLFICDAIKIEERYRYGILLYALHHDLNEIITGDISTVAKDIIRQEAGSNPINRMDCLIPKVTELRERTGSLGRVVVKMADLIDAIVFLENEGVNSHAKAIQERLTNSLKERIIKATTAWPTYHWEGVLEVLDNAINGEDIII